MRLAAELGTIRALERLGRATMIVRGLPTTVLVRNGGPFRGELI